MELKKKITFWIEEKRDVIVVTLILVVVLVSILAGVRMQRNYSAQKRAEEEVQKPQKVRLPEKSKKSAEKKDSPSEQLQTKPSGSYFLELTPEQVLDIVQKMGEEDLPPVNQEYTGLPVMWPAYFFQVVKQEAGKATILLDVSEDGFGVMIQTDVDVNRFPKILDVDREKIWVAGAIQGVEGTGTGTIYMVADEVRFQENLLDAIKGKVTQSNEPDQELSENEESSSDSMTEEEEKQ